MFRAPERHRLKTGKHSSNFRDGNNGLFIFSKFGIYINCIVSDGLGWEHVSVSLGTRGNKRMIKRCPTWREMCFIKEMFWSPEDAVIQVHPAKSKHVNFHPYCLHLWRPIGLGMVLPPSELVGAP